VNRARPGGDDRLNRTPVAVGLEGSGADHLRSVLAKLASLDGVSVVEHSLE